MNPSFESSVRDLLNMRIAGTYTQPAFVSDVTKPMLLDEIIDNQVLELSGT